MPNFGDLKRYIPKFGPMISHPIKLAVITYEDKGTYAPGAVPDEDMMLKQLLLELGIEATFEIWSDETVNWSRYSHLLLKSPWDYFDKYPLFLSWCQQIKAMNIEVFNPIDTVLWNSDKHYLLDIQAKGFPIVPTAFIPAGEELKIDYFFEMYGAEKLVIKPAVSGGSKNTLQISRQHANLQVREIAAAMQQEDFMVQPFVPEVAQTGEFSYIFFKNKYSHAVLKSPKAGEFRVQHFFGGAVHAVKPSEDQLDYLQRLVDTFAHNLLYARVDGIWREGIFYLMELELIEPYLFLYKDPEALINYKSAIEKCLFKR